MNLGSGIGYDGHLKWRGIWAYYWKWCEVQQREEWDELWDGVKQGVSLHILLGNNSCIHILIQLFGTGWWLSKTKQFKSLNQDSFVVDGHPMPSKMFSNTCSLSPPDAGDFHSVMKPKTAVHHALPSLGFSRQEHWSGVPFPSPTHESEKWKWSRSVVSDSWQPHGLQPTRLLRPWDFPGMSWELENDSVLVNSASVSTQQKDQKDSNS